MMAAAKVVAIAAFLRPNATMALCSVRSRGISALPFRRRIASYGLSSGHLLMVTPSIHRRGFCIKATTDSDSPAASFESPLMESMEKKIKEHLSAESVIVKDAYGDGRHVSIEVVSSAFEGQSAVSRQRMVYKAIWEELQDRVHAVDQMTTRTPAEVKH